MSAAISPRNRGAALVAVTGGILVAAGSLLPWMSLFAGLRGFPGILGLYGRLTFAGGVFLALGGLAMIVRTERFIRPLVASIGVAIALFAGWILFGLRATTQRLEEQPMLVARPGPGLFVVLAGALMVAALAFQTYRVGKTEASSAVPHRPSPKGAAFRGRRRLFLYRMHPRISELLEYIDRQAATLRTEFEAVTPERRAVRPSPDRWSPAEVIHHVVIVERRLVTRLTALVEQARAFAPEHDSSSVFTVVDPSRFISRVNRFRTSELGEPRDTDASRVWTDFETTRRELKEVIRSADGLALSEVSAPHPALGPLTGYGWIAFAGAHAARHAAQIKEDALVS